MSYQNNRTVASMITGAIAAVAYMIYATGQSAPAVSDVRAWAGMMLLFIGIAVVASVIVQLVFHIALSLGIAAKNQTKSDREIKKIIRTTTREDEMEKSIVLKSSRVGYMVSGLGLLVALLLLDGKSREAVETNAKIENTIRVIKEAQAEKEKTRQVRQELTEFRESMEALATREQDEKIARKMHKLQEKQNRKKEKKAQGSGNEGLTAQELAEQKAKQEAERLKSIVPGCMVKIKGQSSVGEVMEVNGKNAVIAFGSIKTTAKLDRLERTNVAPQKVDSSTKSTFVSNQTQDSMYEKKLNFKQDIDVRGMRGDEALQAVTYFIDDAILVGMSRVRILHGTGTGILRTLIRQYLQTVSGIRHFADEHVQFGGAGITVVDL